MIRNYDLDELKSRCDLVELFAELIGPTRREGPRWRARCPSPDHGPQTGRTPPVSIEAEGRLWRCHACGAGGSAIDLVMYAHGLNQVAAIDLLAHRAGLSGTAPQRLPRPAGSSLVRGSAVDPRPVSVIGPKNGALYGVLSPANEGPGISGPSSETRHCQGDPAALEAYVAGCEAALWSPIGERALAWLRGRGLVDEVLRANRVGADPGGVALTRAKGLPDGPGVVFPVLEQGRLVYLQLHTMGRGSAKYRNPTTAEWGANVRVAVTGGVAEGDVVLICEGMPDALTAAGAGYRAAAVLGTEAPDAAAARRLVEAYPREALVLALDADPAGRRAADALTALLQSAGAGRRVYRLEIPEEISADPKERDLNGWRRVAGDAFPAALTETVARAAPAGWEPVPSAADRLPAFLDKVSRTGEAVAIPTGFPTLDRLLADGGWRPGLVLLGGLPGIGKTAFALQSALHATGRGHPVLYVSVEQSDEELLGRLFCRELGLPIAAYWNREPAYAAGARQVADRLHLARLYLRSDPTIVGEDHDGTMGRVRRWALDVAEVTGAVPLVVVDYLQRMRPAEADRRLDERLRISTSGCALRQLARDLDAPVLVLSSVGRDNYEGPPSLRWFKGSGDLEYDADACIILRPTPAAPAGAQDHLELHLVKSRYGCQTLDRPIPMLYDRRFGSYREIARTANGSIPPAPPPRLSAGLTEEG